MMIRRLPRLCLTWDLKVLQRTAKTQDHTPREVLHLSLLDLILSKDSTHKHILLVLIIQAHHPLDTTTHRDLLTLINTHITTPIPIRWHMDMIPMPIMQT